MRTMFGLLIVIGAQVSVCATLAEDRPGTRSGDAKTWFVDPRRLPDAKDANKDVDKQAHPVSTEVDEERKRLLEETEMRLKAQEQDLAAREARAKAQAEELKRLTEEAKQKAEQAPHTVQEDGAGSASTKVRGSERTPTTTVPAFAVECPRPSVMISPVDGGRAKVAVLSSCRAEQPVELHYGPFKEIRRLDNTGQIEFVVDLFQGPNIEAALRFADGESEPLKFDTVDLSGMTKIALVWTAPINLDLHAFEYSAAVTDRGHVWPGSPSDPSSASALVARDGRAHCFLSKADDGKHEGDKIEVMTVWGSNVQKSGVVAMALDYVTRGERPSGETCGDGALAEPEFKIVVRDATGTVSEEGGAIRKLPCGTKVPESTRFIKGLVPDVRFRP